ncbi:tetratricopeptide repeat-containing diguanylate cyclase [Lysinibacillus sp. KU-BSD001]|uniref:tetratricopeptide repeat-containing diguanylate cyclase n=1 Tax=Lysinibacillus sp. KU-BSD001 TaxID=3141328 RepID=UPI0036E89EB4
MQSYYESQLEVARELFRKTQCDITISILDAELPKIEKEKNYKLLCEYLNLKIAAYLTKGDIKSVEPLLEPFKIALTESGNEELKANYPYHAATFFYMSGDIERSIEYNLRAFKIIENNPSHLYYIGICINLSSCYLLLKDFEKAQYYREKIVTHIKFNKHEYPLAYFHYMNNYAFHLFELKRYDEAYEMLNNVLTHPLIRENTKHYAMTICNMGVYYSRVNQWEKADNYLEKSWSIFENFSDVQAKGRFLTSIINAYEEMGNYKQAYKYARIKNDLLESEESQRQQARLHEFALSTSKDSLTLLIYTDKLTQVHSRYYFDEQSEKWLQEAIEQHTPLCCALFDIDNFKKQNDCYGHVVGDQILQQIGIVANQFQHENELFIARYGGDEFIVFSKNVELFNKTIEHLFSTLQAVEIPYEDTYLSFTISLGAVVIENLSDYTVSMMIEQADKKLYEVKKTGKNNLKVG